MQHAGALYSYFFYALTKYQINRYDYRDFQEINLPPDEQKRSNVNEAACYGRFKGTEATLVGFDKTMPNQVYLSLNSNKIICHPLAQSRTQSLLVSYCPSPFTLVPEVFFRREENTMSSDRQRSGERKSLVTRDANLTIMLQQLSINITRSINKIFSLFITSRFAYRRFTALLLENLWHPGYSPFSDLHFYSAQAEGRGPSLKMQFGFFCFSFFSLGRLPVLR